ncbi:MAG: hypothetical protein IPP64_11770 [Bacteroidetes bacterium]|nr:hypothetical protein [Bacteroidota bacterium]
MENMECKIEYVKDVLGILAILIGGAWTFWRFVLQREKHPKVQFDVDLKLIGTQKESHLVEVISIIENKGLVRHYIKDFSFDLFYLTDKDEFEEGGKEINNQIKFKKIIDKRPWIKRMNGIIHLLMQG